MRASVSSRPDSPTREKKSWKPPGKHSWFGTWPHISEVRETESEITAFSAWLPVQRCANRSIAGVIFAAQNILALVLFSGGVMGRNLTAMRKSKQFTIILLPRKNKAPPTECSAKPFCRKRNNILLNISSQRNWVMLFLRDDGTAETYAKASGLFVLLYSHGTRLLWSSRNKVTSASYLTQKSFF